MAKVGIFFGTDTGKTRQVAKSIAKLLGSEIADKPVNVLNATVEAMLAYQVLILGTPTYGEGLLPGKSTGNMTESWEEFLPLLNGADFSGKTVAIYGLGNQETYPHEFVSAMIYLYRQFKQCNATLIGAWNIDGYQFTHSQAVLDGQFVGLALDNEIQRDLTDARLKKWLEMIAPAWQ
jgi:flavodoxin I